MLENCIVCDFFIIFDAKRIIHYFRQRKGAVNGRTDNSINI